MDLANAPGRFNVFFQMIDNFPAKWFLWLTAYGIDTELLTDPGKKAMREVDTQLGDDDEDPEGGEG